MLPEQPRPIVTNPGCVPVLQGGTVALEIKHHCNRHCASSPKFQNAFGRELGGNWPATTVRSSEQLPIASLPTGAQCGDAGSMSLSSHSGRRPVTIATLTPAPGPSFPGFVRGPPLRARVASNEGSDEELVKFRCSKTTLFCLLHTLLALHKSGRASDGVGPLR